MDQQVTPAWVANLGTEPDVPHNHQDKTTQEPPAAWLRSVQILNRANHLQYLPAPKYLAAT